MSDGLSFGLEAMRDLALDIEKQEKLYRDSVDQIQTLITKIGQSWTSEETGTYEAFKNLFEQKYPSLIDGDTLMLEFKKSINTHADNFEGASKESIAKYE
mgnify:CR=1 FL=1